MTNKAQGFRYVEDLDLDRDPVTLPDGTLLDEKKAEAYGREVADRAARKRRGRPSLTAPGVHSPHVSSRVTPELKARIDEIARRDGLGTSDVLRSALEEYVEAHG